MDSEAQLQRLAKEYQEIEHKKTLRWFPSVGEQLPSEAEVKQNAMLRQAWLDDVAAQRRAAERRQTTAALAQHAVVPADAHPAFSMPAAEVEAEAPATYGAAAAATVERKKHLHLAFTDGLWLMLAQMRAERRLQRMMAAQRQRAAVARTEATTGGGAARTSGPGKVDDSTARGESMRSVYQLPVKSIAVLTLPALPPAADATSNGGVSGPSVSLHAALADEKPTPADAEAFVEKELKQPFEFKLRHYAPFKYTDHHFAVCDGKEVPQNFPAGPAEAAEAQADEPVPALPGPFTQPAVTLERFPGYDFVFERTLPHANLVNGRAPQPITNGGFKDPLLRFDFGQAAASLAHPHDTVRWACVAKPLPAPMRAAAAEDSMSDDDDAEDDVALPKPSSLLAIAASFLPAFASNTAGGDPVQGGQRGVSRAESAAGPAMTSGSAAADCNSPPSNASQRKPSSVGIGALAGENALADDHRPIHNTGRATANAEVAASLGQTRAVLEALATKLPASHRLTF